MVTNASCSEKTASCQSSVARQNMAVVKEDDTRCEFDASHLQASGDSESWREMSPDPAEPSPAGPRLGGTRCTVPLHPAATERELSLEKSCIGVFGMWGESTTMSAGGCNVAASELPVMTTRDVHTAEVVSADAAASATGRSTDQIRALIAKVPSGSAAEDATADLATDSWAVRSAAAEACSAARAEAEETTRPAETVPDPSVGVQLPGGPGQSSCRGKNGEERVPAAAGGSALQTGSGLQDGGVELSSDGGKVEREGAVKGAGRDVREQEPVCRLRWCFYNVEALLKRLSSLESVVSPPFHTGCAEGPVYIRLDPIHPAPEETAERNAGRSLRGETCPAGQASTSPSATAPSSNGSEGFPPIVPRKGGGKGANQRFTDRSLGEQKTMFDWDSCRFGVFVACCAYSTLEFSVQIVDPSVCKDVLINRDDPNARVGDDACPSSPEQRNCEDVEEEVVQDQCGRDGSGPAKKGSRDPCRVLADSGRLMYSSRDQKALWHGIPDFASLSSAADRSANLLIVDVVIHSATPESPPAEIVDVNLPEDLGKKREAGASASRDATGGTCDSEATAEVGAEGSTALSDSRIEPAQSDLGCGSLEEKTRDRRSTSSSEPSESLSTAGLESLGPVPNPPAAGPPGMGDKRRPGATQPCVGSSRGGGGNPLKKRSRGATRPPAAGEDVTPLDPLSSSARCRTQNSTRRPMEDAAKTAGGGCPGKEVDTLPSTALRVEDDRVRGSCDEVLEEYLQNVGAKGRSGGTRRVKGMPDLRGVLPGAGDILRYRGGADSAPGKHGTIGVFQPPRSQVGTGSMRYAAVRGTAAWDVGLPVSADHVDHRLALESLIPVGDGDETGIRRRGGKGQRRPYGARGGEFVQYGQMLGVGAGSVSGCGASSARKRREKQRQHRRRRGSSDSAKGDATGCGSAAWHPSGKLDRPPDAERIGAAIETIIQARSAADSGATDCRLPLRGEAQGHSVLPGIWTREQRGPHGGRDVATGLGGANSRPPGLRCPSGGRTMSHSVNSLDPSGLTLLRHETTGRRPDESTSPYVKSRSDMCGYSPPCAGDESHWKADPSRGGEDALLALNMLLSLAGGDRGEGLRQSLMTAGSYCAAVFQENTVASGVVQGSNPGQRPARNRPFAEAPGSAVGAAAGGVRLPGENSYGHLDMGRDFQDPERGLGPHGRAFPVASAPALPQAPRSGLEVRRAGESANVPSSVSMQSESLSASLRDEPIQPQVLVQYARALQAAAGASSLAQQSRSGGASDIAGGAVFQPDRLSAVDASWGLGQDAMAGRQRRGERIQGQEALGTTYSPGGDSVAAQRENPFYSSRLAALDEADREAASRGLARALLGDCAIPDATLGVRLRNANEVTTSSSPPSLAPVQSTQFPWQGGATDAQPPQQGRSAPSRLTEGDGPGSAGANVSSLAAAAAVDLGLGSRGVEGPLAAPSLSGLGAVARLHNRDGLSFDGGVFSGIFPQVTEDRGEALLRASRMLDQQLFDHDGQAVQHAYEQQMHPLDGIGERYTRNARPPYEASRSSCGHCCSPVPHASQKRKPPEEEVTRDYALRYVAENIGRLRRDAAERESLAGRHCSAVRGRSVTLAARPRTLPPSGLAEDSPAGGPCSLREESAREQ
ncbi:hypothetical protein BESB_079980 [Besnoitia besnoiti]|uniref:Uncharacterized protein n=1 Tax=Besnoitia besnoiti TaxID=94643 RepID=A0A2A9MEH4_BESBE|nr:hypothetical protein BESB_079980 [Besnoitia besnoiti]PFH33782.1 hypothetical protein BESB_079980 [Besnoitia besnoiti]